MVSIVRVHCMEDIRLAYPGQVDKNLVNYNNRILILAVNYLRNKDGYVTNAIDTLATSEGLLSRF